MVTKMRITQHFETNAIVTSGKESPPTKKQSITLGGLSFLNLAKFLTLPITFDFCSAFSLVISCYFIDYMKEIFVLMKAVPEEILLKCHKYKIFSSSFVERRKSKTLLLLKNLFSTSAAGFMWFPLL